VDQIYEHLNFEIMSETDMDYLQILRLKEYK